MFFIVDNLLDGRERTCDHRSGSFLLSDLGKESSDKLSLGHVSEVGLLGRGRLAHGLRLHDGDLLDGHGHRLRSVNFEVLGVPELRLLLDHRLDELVVDLLLDGSGDDDLLHDLGGRVAAQESLGVSLLEGLLGLGLEDKGLEGVLLDDSGGDLLGSGLLVEFLLLGHDLLDNLLALGADSDSSVGVLHEGVERVSLFEVSVEGLKGNVESDADGKGGDESDESTGALEVLGELLVRGFLELEVSEEGHGGGALDVLLLGLEFSGLLRKDSHGDVVGTAH